MSDVTVRRFPFAFDTPGLLTGYEVHTPAVGDILLDAWVEIDEAWDGTTPSADVGTFTAGHTGWFNTLSGGADSVDLTQADSTSGSPAFAGLLTGTTLSGLRSAQDVLMGADDDSTGIYAVSGAVVNAGATPLSGRTSAHYGNRLVPSKFVTADPIKVVVSQDGKNNGADPGSTQGHGFLWLVMATMEEV